MPARDGFERKVMELLRKPERLPDEFKAWIPRLLEGNINLIIDPTQIPNVKGERWKKVGAGEDVAYGGSPSWQDYGSGAGGAKFYKDYLGIVHLSGLVTPAVNPGSLAIFSLPAGYRPEELLLFEQHGHNGAYVACRVDIDTGGTVSIVNPANTTFTAVGAHYISLAGIHFRAYA